MKKSIYIVLALAMAAALLSCNREELSEPGIYSPSSSEILINPVLGDGDWTPVSKAVADLEANEVDESYLKDHGFGLYAYYTGADPFEDINVVKGLVFNNRKFIYDSGAWKNYQWYDGSAHEGKNEFWPTNANDNLTFFAYAPWDTWHDKVATSSGKASPYIVYDNYVAADLSTSQLEAQKDILWGSNSFGNTHKDVKMSDYTPEGTVDMHFRHATAKINFAVRGSLSGESVSQLNSVDPTESNVGSLVSDNPDPEETVQTIRYVYSKKSGSGPSSTTYYYCVERETTTYTQHQTTTQTLRQSMTGVSFSHEGSRYLINNVNLTGFKEKGTLLLDNASAYEPSWTDVSGTVYYTLSSSNVLTQSLQNPGDAATIKSNINVYTGVSESATDLMSGYFLYAIPLTSNSVGVSLNYSQYYVSAYTLANQHRDVTRTRTQTNTRTYIRERVSDRKSGSGSSSHKITDNWAFSSGWVDSGNDLCRRNSGTKLSGSDYDGGYSETSLGYSPGSTTYHSGTPTDWQYPDDPYITDSETPDPSKTTTVTFNSTKEVSGSVVSSFQGGRAYVINLILSGKQLELTVVPRPWELEETDFDYTGDENKVIQGLTYDSAFIDYADPAGNVYINNRMGKFYFKLGEGRYKIWQASLVGDAAFGFTDENGNWLYEADGVTKVTSIRAAIDEDVMNYLYIKALDSSSTVTSRAKLRIYGIDSNGDATAMLNLVDMDGVVEWTIVQNAN